MKKYKVLKTYPKPIMNSGRMVVLSPKDVVYLKYEKQLERLIKLGYIAEVREIKPKETKPVEEINTKPLIQPKKPKAKYQEDSASGDKKIGE